MKTQNTKRKRQKTMKKLGRTEKKTQNTVKTNLTEKRGPLPGPLPDFVEPLNKKVILGV